MRRGRVGSQPCKQIDRRKVGSEEETDERVAGVGESVMEERYRRRNAGSGDGNENQMHRERDEGRGAERKVDGKGKSMTHGAHEPVS